MREREEGFGTLAVHAGQSPDPTTGAVMTPVYQTSTYVQESLGHPRGGFEYARTHNPTRAALEANIAALEGGRHGIAYSSGLAATEAIMKRLSAGDHVICEDNTYGGTPRLFNQVLARFGIEFTYVDTRDPEKIRDALRPSTKLIFAETPTNPMMRITDLRLLGGIAREAGAHLVVDNTFASPFNQRPLELGATIVVHSSTKYLNGHSDVVSGMVITDDEEVASELRFLQNAAGAVPGPWDCWLVLRGTKTLHLRMTAHNQNGLRMARYLEEHAGVERVYYPGLPSHPQHDLARLQMKGFTGMVSMELGSLERARQVVNSTRIFQLAESLGGVESLIGHPATQTHAAVPAEKRQALGITDGLVRLSVGIEDVDDLIEDIDQALRGV
jgi:cystathionine beta-lyase/cystathionine gamma-synthase